MLNIEKETYNGLQTVKLIGQLTGIAALELRQSIAATMDSKAEEVILDLHGMKAIDLTGFNAIVMIKKETELERIKFSIHATSESPFQEYLHLSKLNINCVSSSSH